MWKEIWLKSKSPKTHPSAHWREAFRLQLWQVLFSELEHEATFQALQRKAILSLDLRPRHLTHFIIVS